jgi:ADP-heptose:LPS heptosyltransferase
VWVNTTLRGYDVLKHDPNIDGWWLQDPDQVPNDLLSLYWSAMASRFGKVVNLSESVECRFLVPYNKIESNFSAETLRRICAGNYGDYACDLAGIPRKNQTAFYPTSDEKEWAKKQRKKLGDVPVILWSLSGSSIHKAYPWTDNVIAAMMLHSNAKVVMVGDNLCQLLEDGWREEDRVWRRSGKWSIRETLAFAQQADVVVGPETGVLNAVAMEKVGKVLMLSHSTVENLSRDWVNTVNLIPKVDCYPCHRLHYSFDYCRRDEATHGAACAVSIPPEAVYDAIVRLLPGG